MMRLKSWCLAFGVAAMVGCGSDSPSTPPPPPPPKDASTDTSVPTDKPTPEDNPQPPTDNPTPGDTPTPEDVPSSDMPAPMCEMGQTRCGDSCVDTQTNNANCGMCGTMCSMGQTCRMGACMAETPCMAGQTACGTMCVDTSTDAMNCGSCGSACPAGQSCVGGTCMAPSCPMGQTRCGTACVDTATDAANCGTCGNACSAGQMCMASTCQTVRPCGAGETACGGVCVNTMTDANNCGGCGVVCMADRVCMGGNCRAMACPAGQIRCGGVCTNTMTDNANCGMCGRSCAMGQTCMGGTCMGTVMMCLPGQTDCDPSPMLRCADLMSDEANCGMCGRACTAMQTCVRGTCTATSMCMAGQTNCGTTEMPRCVNTMTDNANCGACGTACAMGTTCQMGACRCPIGSTLCGRSCVNTMTDAANCGACGRACPTGQVCTGGRCGCAVGRTLCSGTCVDTATDAANCGMCGTACGTGQICTAGRCGCPMGQTLCGTGAAARCVNLQTDRTNCGMCARTCSMGQSCVAGACACPMGQTLCGAGAAAACVDLMTSAANCGMCGRACPPTQSCMGGMCRGTPPANDTRAGATVINLGAGNAQNLMANTISARHDTNGACNCTTVGNDVFYTFTLTQPEFIYADTLGATWDTALFIQDSIGNNLTPPAAGQVTCNDDNGTSGLCGSVGSGLQSQVFARLNPGRYFLVLSGCSAGLATIHFQHLPAGNGPTSRIAPNASVQTVMGTTSGTGTTTSACCSAGPENSYWWITCPGATATTFYASSCSTTTGMNLAGYDVAITQSSALRTPTTACNDDTGFVCGAGATTTSTIGATAANVAGINSLIADSCAGSGAYTIQYVLANCASGTRCAGACVDTASDENNCGGCNRRCAAGQTCVAGACQAVRAGETRFNAIEAPAGNTVAVVNTAFYRNDTTGACGCTAGNDVFYTFTLTAPEIVYADTVGSTFDTSLFLQDSMGNNIVSAGLPAGTTCNDDGGLAGCATGRQSQIMAQLAAGQYFLVLSGCATGIANVRLQRIAVGNGPARALAQGSSVVSGTTMGTGRVTATCCSGGPEDTFYWYTCPSFTGGNFNASTCGRATWDTELAQLSPGRGLTAVCNDDACGPRQSLVSTMIPPGAGLHAFYVDGCGVASGAYTAAVTRP